MLFKPKSTQTCRTVLSCVLVALSFWLAASTDVAGAAAEQTARFGPAAGAAHGSQRGVSPDVSPVGLTAESSVARETLTGAAAPGDVRFLDTDNAALRTLPDWLDRARVGYDDGFIIAGAAEAGLNSTGPPFRLKINGWGQIRHTEFDSKGVNLDVNQFQLKRARLIFSGNAFSPDCAYHVQLDGRSSSGDNMRLLDYDLVYDFGHHLWCLAPGTIGYRAGKYKMPFHLARSVSGREFEMADRSMASTFFDVNRSLAWGLFGRLDSFIVPVHWETAVFNGLVTGGAESGSSGELDNNFAYSARLFAFPTGDWGKAALADLSFHSSPATRIGAGFAFSTVERSGSTEFSRSRVVDSGLELSSILPDSVNAYSVALFALDASTKYRGMSITTEYYLRNISVADDSTIPDLFDHGFWLQTGYFILPHKLELIGRWSRVVGNSGTLGRARQSADEVAGGLAWYIKGQHVKLTADLTHLDGAPVDSAALDLSPGDIGWLCRTQLQFSF